MNEPVKADFDRILSTIVGLPDTKTTKPATILDVYPLLYEKNVTFVVQTHRNKEAGFTVFLQIVDAEGSRRVVVPPKVAAAIYRQRQALTDRSTPESRKRRAASAERKRQAAERAARKAAYAKRNGTLVG